MKLNNLLYTFESPELEFYFLSRKKLEEGIYFSYKVKSIDPFAGIAKDHSFELLYDDMGDLSSYQSGFFSFLMNTSLFDLSMINYQTIMNSSLVKLMPEIPLTFFSRISLFDDEKYELYLKSGNYSTKSETLTIDQIKKKEFKDDDELILNIVKNKELKIFLKLKESGNKRKHLEGFIENVDLYLENIFKIFIQKIKSKGFRYKIRKEKNINTIERSILKLFGVETPETEEIDTLIEKINYLNVNDFSLKKDSLFFKIISLKYYYYFSRSFARDPEKLTVAQIYDFILKDAVKDYEDELNKIKTKTNDLNKSNEIEIYNSDEIEDYD